MKVGVVGATEIIGETLIELLQDSILPIDTLYLMTTTPQLDKLMIYKDKIHSIHAINEIKLEDIDLIFFLENTKESKFYIEKAIESGCVVISHSSDCQLKKEVPLVVSQVNIDCIQKENKIISIPNVITLPLTIVLYYLNQINRVKRLDVVGFQELRHLETKFLQTELKSDDKYRENGYTNEELNLIWETLKILNAKFEISSILKNKYLNQPYIQHVTVTFLDEVDEAVMKEVLEAERCIKIMGSKKNELFPPSSTIHIDRIRSDLFADNILHFFIVTDCLHKCAAANALDIAEYCYIKQIYGW